MFYKQQLHHILIGLFISCGYIPAIQSMVYLENADDNAPMTVDAATARMYPPLTLLPTFHERGYIRWQEDPANQNFSRIDLPFLLSKASEELPIITRSQSKFIKKFKKMALPHVISDENLHMLRSLNYMEFFELHYDSKTAECILHQHPLLPIKKANNSSKTLPKKRKHKDTEWKAISINDSGDLITEAKLPLLLYRERKNIFTKPEQQRFLKKFKKADFPYTVNDEEKAIFDSLKFQSMFITKKTNAGWEINLRSSVPTKIINMD